MCVKVVQGVYLDPVILCVGYSGNADEHGVAFVHCLQFHPHLEAMWRSLKSKNMWMLCR